MEVVTDYYPEHLNLTWIVKNFNLLPHEAGEYIESNLLTSVDGSEWMMRFLPRGDKFDRDKSKLYLVFTKSGHCSKIKVKLHLNVYCLGYNRSSINEFTFSMFSTMWCYDMTRSELLCKEDKLTGLDLTIKCELAILWEGNVSTKLVLKDAPVRANDCATFHADIGRLFVDQLGCDLTINVSDEQIRAHKCILMARSPVFAVMFSNKLQEACTNSITICDTKADVLREMLMYMYTGSVELKDLDLTLGLYAAADKYQLISLKNQCSDFLSASLTPQNVLDVFSVADLHSDEGLKKMAKTYISSLSRDGSRHQ